MPRQEKSPKKKSKKSEEEDPAMDPAAINELVKNAIDQANAEADARAKQKLEERLKEAEDSRLTKKLDDEVLEIQSIVEQGATVGIPGSGNSRELSGIPGSDFSLPGSENWENRQNPPVIVDAADAFCTMGRIWPSRCPRRTSYGPKVP